MDPRFLNLCSRRRHLSATSVACYQKKIYIIDKLYWGSNCRSNTVKTLYTSIFSKSTVTASISCCGTLLMMTRPSYDADANNQGFCSAKKKKKKKKAKNVSSALKFVFLLVSEPRRQPKTNKWSTLNPRDLGRSESSGLVANLSFPSVLVSMADDSATVASAQEYPPSGKLQNGKI